MESAPKPIRGAENMVDGKEYFEVGAVNPGCMWITGPFTVHGEPFVPRCFPRRRDSLFVRVIGHNLGDEISLRDRHVIGDQHYNNCRLFEYTPGAYAYLKGLVDRRVFYEYRDLIGLTFPAHYHDQDGNIW